MTAALRMAVLTIAALTIRALTAVDTSVDDGRYHCWWWYILALTMIAALTRITALTTTRFMMAVLLWAFVLYWYINLPVQYKRPGWEFGKEESKRNKKKIYIYLEKRVVRPTRCKTHCRWAHCRQTTWYIIIHSRPEWLKNNHFDQFFLHYQ